MQLALALCAPHGLWFSTSPHSHYLSHQEMKAIQSYLPHITFKISTFGKTPKSGPPPGSVKMFLPSHSACCWSHPTTVPLCRATSWSCSEAKHRRLAPKCTFCKAYQPHPLLPHTALATQHFMPIKKWKVLLISLQAVGNLRPPSHCWKRKQKSPF